MTYTISVPDGNYEVGVQTIKNDWTTSTFTKAEVGVADGIQTTKAIQYDATSIYDANGRQLGADIDGLGRGLFIVKKGNQVTKVIK